MVIFFLARREAQIWHCRELPKKKSHSTKLWAQSNMRGSWERFRQRNSAEFFATALSNGAKVGAYRAQALSFVIGCRTTQEEMRIGRPPARFARRAPAF